MRTDGVRIGLAIAGVVLQAAVAPSMQGQVIRGRLVAAADNAAIAGAMMTLMDRDGRAVERILTHSATGMFELRAPEPGEYRVRAERIGYGTTSSAFFSMSAGDTLTVQISAPVEALSLEGIRAAVGPRCQVRPKEGLAVAQGLGRGAQGTCGGDLDAGAGALPVRDAGNQTVARRTGTQGGVRGPCLRTEPRPCAVCCSLS